MFHVALTDSDTYKFSMANLILKVQPRVKARYAFINRDKREFPDGFARKLREVVGGFRAIQMSKDEKDFMREKCYYLDPAYLDFLEGYHYNPDEVRIEQEGPDLRVTIEGPMYRTIYWEVPLMATISELYFKDTNQARNGMIQIIAAAKSKALGFKMLDTTVSEFGTRRRHSFNVHNNVLRVLKEHAGHALVGTSNIYLAMTHGLTPMGTIAHELFQLYGAIYGYQSATTMLLEDWIKVYQGDLGIGLTDTFTTDVFLKAFNTKYSKLFDGVRHDSGDPLVWLEKILRHYQDHRINPLYKTVLFSDNLHSIEQIESIHNACRGCIHDAYGVGTWFTCDCGVKPLNIVIKLVACDFGYGWVDTVKLSDNVGKNTGACSAVALCKQILGIKE